MMIFAHRGAAPNRRRENTLGAFRAALAAGCQLESDARVTKDGVAVLVHDAFLPRWPFVRLVRHRTAAQLAKHGVPTITDVYEALGTDYELSIDLKVGDAAPLLIAAADRADATDRLWLVSDKLDLLRGLRATSQRVRLVHESRQARIGDRTAHSELLAAESINAQNTDVLGWQPASVEHSHACGVLAFGSLANDQKRFDRARDLGIDALYTDRLDLVGSGRS
jgi:glycerophosphoryl diester phosphodiesterase